MSEASDLVVMVAYAIVTFALGVSLGITIGDGKMASLMHQIDHACDGVEPGSRDGCPSGELPLLPLFAALAIVGTTFFCIRLVYVALDNGSDEAP